MPAGAGVLVLMEVMQPKPHFFLRQTRIMDERNGGRGRQDGEFLAGMADRGGFCARGLFPYPPEPRRAASPPGRCRKVLPGEGSNPVLSSISG